ncbi:MAG: hypothetical protein PHH31_09230 [Acidaminococcaceae bacterium]|nr:hypothetical protein [Acidaminococcaceae bacterium]
MEIKKGRVEKVEMGKLDATGWIGWLKVGYDWLKVGCWSKILVKLPTFSCF